MMLSGSDLKKLRLPLAGAVVLIGIGAAALFSCNRFLDEARNQKRSIETELATARTRVASVSEEEREIRDNLVHFRSMSERGMVGPEKRLEWIESIGRIRQRRRLYDVRYKVEPQRPVDYSGIAQPPKGDAPLFMASRVKMELQLLHEEDLFNFLDDLKASGNALLSVRSCSITRVEGGGQSGGPLRPRLGASCTVDFVTLKLPGTA